MRTRLELIQSGVPQRWYERRSVWSSTFVAPWDRGWWRLLYWDVSTQKVTTVTPTPIGIAYSVGPRDGEYRESSTVARFSQYTNAGMCGDRRAADEIERRRLKALIDADEATP